MSKGIGNVVPAVVTEQIEDGIAQGSEHMRRIARMGLIGILAHGNVAHIVNSVFDGPMAAPQLLEAGCTDFGVRQAGDTVGGRRADLSGFQSDALISPTHHLAHTGPVNVV